MLSRFRARLTYANVVATLALFLALGGVAYAGATIGSDDVVNDSLKSVDLMDDAAVKTQDVVNDSDPTGGLTAPDLRPDSVGGSEVTSGSLTGTDIGDNSLAGSDIGDNSLAGSDINEGSLGQVPQSLLGGFGRSTSVGGECNPNGESFVTCAFTTLNIPAPGTRVLMVGTIRASTEIDPELGIGDCRVSTSTGQIPSGTWRVVADDGDNSIEHVPLTGITTPLGPGPVDFGVECNEITGGIRYSDMTISAVAIAPN